MQHYEGTWGWANGSYKGVTAYVLTFGGLELFPESRYLKAGGSPAHPAFNLIQTEDWPSFGGGGYTADSLNTLAGTVGIGFPELLSWILQDAATLGKDRSGTLPYLDEPWVGWNVERISNGTITPFFGSIYGPLGAYQYVAYKIDPVTHEPTNAGPTAPPGTPPAGSPDPGAVGPTPKTKPVVPPTGKRPVPPVHPPAVTVPAPAAIADVSVTIPEDTPLIDPLNDLPGDIIEVPYGGGSGGGGGGTNPADQPLVSWQPILKQGIDRPNAIFGWEVAPRNVKTMKRLDDGDTTANQITATGGTTTEAAKWRGTWDAGTSYTTGQIVVDANGFMSGDGIFQAKSAPPSGFPPLSRPAYWLQLFGSSFWNAGTTFGEGYFVAFTDGLLYRASRDVVGTVPGTDDRVWVPVDHASTQPNLTYKGQDDDSIALIGVYADTESYPFAASMATLIAMVTASLRRRRFGTQLISFEPQNGHPALPRPWADYDKGDTVRVRASTALRGGLPTRILNAFGRPLEKQRVNGWDIELTNDGVENVTKIYTEEDLG